LLLYHPFHFLHLRIKGNAFWRLPSTLKYDTDHSHQIFPLIAPIQTSVRPYSFPIIDSSIYEINVYLGPWLVSVLLILSDRKLTLIPYSKSLKSWQSLCWLWRFLLVWRVKFQIWPDTPCSFFTSGFVLKSFMNI
jgi:hypothetical protein